MLEQKTGDSPEWEKRSTSQEIAQEEISNEETLLMEAYKSTNEYFNELYQLTRLVYGMLRYTMAVDRIIPLLKKMGRDFAEGEKLRPGNQMTRRFIIDKEDGSKEIIDGHCENCGSSVRGFYDLFSYGHHKKWICRKC